MSLGKNKQILIAVGVLASVGANAQTVSTWFNVQGSAASSQPAFIDVLPGATVNLSVYLNTSLTDVSDVYSLLGYTTATSTGSSATPASSLASIAFTGTASSATIPSLSWNSALGGATLFGNRFGGGAAASGTRPYGLWTSSNANFGSFLAITPNVNTRLYDVTVTVSNAAVNGNLIPITLHGGSSDTFNSFVSSNFNNFFPSAYTANLRVVPEPATMAVLGLGLVGLARKRRNK